MSAPGAACHTGFDGADVDTLFAVFVDGIRALESARMPYVLIGGLASAALGRPRASADIDLLVTPYDARRALQALGDAGFDTDEINPHWLFKAVKGGVLIDLLFSRGRAARRPDRRAPTCWKTRRGPLAARRTRYSQSSGAATSMPSASNQWRVAGSERGVTPGGVRVRNVALPVVKQAYRVFEFAGATPEACTSTAPATV